MYLQSILGSFPFSLHCRWWSPWSILGRVSSLMQLLRTVRMMDACESVTRTFSRVTQVPLMVLYTLRPVYIAWNGCPSRSSNHRIRTGFQEIHHQGRRELAERAHDRLLITQIRFLARDPLTDFDLALKSTQLWCLWEKPDYYTVRQNKLLF